MDRYSACAGQGRVAFTSIGLVLGALALISCGSGDGANNDGDTSGTGGASVIGSETGGVGGTGNNVSAIGGTVTNGTVTNGTVTNGTVNGGSSSGGSVTGGTSGTGTSTTICIGTPTSTCNDRLCDRMPGCTANAPAVCGGEAKVCSSYDGNTTGCDAQWGCGIGANGLCAEYDTTCSDHNSEASCTKFSGCWWSGLYCNGDIVKNCTTRKDRSGCVQNPACFWTASTVSYCEGVSTPCASMKSETCEMQAGCTLTPATCSGTPTPCEVLSTDQCLMQPGCRYASGKTNVITPTGLTKNGPDLVFATFTLKRAAYSGKDVLSLDFEELNRGGVDAGAHTNRIYLSQNETVGDADDYELLPIDTSDTLPAYGLNSVALNTYITMPIATELAPGYYHVIGVLDSGKAVTESEEGNNVVVLPVVYVGPQKFDLAAVSLNHTVAATLAPGDAFDLSFTVLNHSTTSVATAAVATRISTDSTLDASDVAVDCTSSLPVALDVDASRAYTINCKAPRARGTYYLLTEVDPKDVLGDANRANNVAVTATAVTIAAPSPDLKLTVLTSDTYSLNWKGSLKLSTTVENTGVDAAPASTVSFYVGGRTLCSASVGALASGASAIVTKDCTLDNASMGTLSLSAKVDPSDAIYEANETNNSFDSATSLTVATPKINLVAAGVGLASGGVERKVNGSPVDVYYKLQNKGTDDAPGFQFIIYASTDTNITKDDTEFCIRDVNAGLPAGTTTKDGVSVSCTMVTLPIGEYYLGMIVDTNGAVLETDESDNVTVDTLNKLTITN